MKRKIATGDCETDPFKFGRTLEAFIWCIFDGEEYHLFKTALEMIDFLKDKKWIVYFHNGGKFDFHFFTELLEPFTYILDINGRLAKFKIGECEFRDSYNIIPQPLSAYKKDDFDYSRMEKNVREKNMRDIIKYLKNDCLFLYELVKAFTDEYGINLTLAASAFKFFNKNFNEHGNIKSSKNFYDEFKTYYYGGRVECFKKGIIDHDFKAYDINSAYPFAMLSDHPYGTNFEELNELPKTAIERCFISLTCKSKGAFPYREKGKSLSFPNDDEIRLYHVTGWEYLTAIKCGAISDTQILKVYRFYQFINFKGYVDYFYDLKNKSVKGTADYIIAKLFLNSLYGKYAANPEKYCETYICAPCHINHSCELLGMDYAGTLGQWAVLERPLPEEKQNYYNVATAASITGFVRAYLFEQITKAKNVLYCDTDCIVCEGGKFETGQKLGQWDLEGEFSGGGIGGKKLYAFKYKKDKKYKTAVKGAKLSPEQILKVCQGKTIKYKSEAPTFSLKKPYFYLEREIKMT